jgi:signal transduction histidine kinase
MTLDAATSDRLKQLRHDVLNCLNVISLGAKALQESPGDAELLEYVCNNIQREQRRATELLSELFDAAGVSENGQADGPHGN